MPTQTVRDLCIHHHQCQVCMVADADNCTNKYKSSSNKSVSNPYSFLPNQQPLKEFDNRLIACNGDCGSRISLIIDYCAHNKVM